METARPVLRAWPQLDLPNVFWFFGAVTAAIASIAVLDKVPESNADVWLLLASVGFLVAYGLASALLYRRAAWVPAGLAATVSAAMTPAAAYAFTRLVDLYPDDPFFDPTEEFSGTVFGIGVVTALVALLAFTLTRFSFLLGAAFLRRATWAAYGALGLYGALFHYLDVHDWMRYVLLGVSLGVFVLGIVVAPRRRAAPSPAAPPPPP